MALPSPRTPRLRRLLFVAITTLVAVSGAAVAGEAWLRRDPTRLAGAGVPADFPPAERACVRASLTRGYAAIPGACGADANGYRVTRVDGPREVPVLFLGDSIGEHAWVRTMATVAAGAANRGMTLHNASLSGYDTCRELSAFVEREFDPALVILQTCPNDIIGTPVLAHLPDGSARYYGGDRAVSFPGWILPSRLLTLAWMRLAVPIDPLGEVRNEVQLEERAALQFGCLARLRTEVAAAGARLAVVSFPYFQGAHLRPEETLLLDGVRAAGLAPFDVRAELVRAGQTRMLTSDDGVHPNGTAHPTIGTLTGRWLASEVEALER